MHAVALSLALAGAALASPAPQLGGLGEDTTGAFGKGGISLSKSGTGSLNIFAGGKEGTGAAGILKGLLGGTKETSGGTGPYKSQLSDVPGLAKHTLYFPINPPTDKKIPAIVWGNGGCSGDGAWFSNLLNEIASHGFIVIANGDSKAGKSSSSTAKDLPAAIDWLSANAGKGKFVNVDATKIAAAGQSCGGIQAYSASVDPRVTVTGIFNSGLLNADNTPLLKTLHAPVGYFLGGPTDIAYANGERDFKNLPANVPAIKANLDAGHFATYSNPNAGKFGKAAVLFFQWHLQGNETAKAQFLQPATSSLTKDGWDIVSRGY